ncbi:hypothetical protein C5860_21280 [Salmonella enterica]|nr:hypothetical protein [Salmonella enterica]
MLKAELEKEVTRLEKIHSLQRDWVNELTCEKVQLKEEVERLKDVIMNCEQYFEFLTKEQKEEADQIFEKSYNPAKPASVYHAVGMVAAYILRGQL